MAGRPAGGAKPADGEPASARRVQPEAPTGGLDQDEFDAGGTGARRKPSDRTMKQTRPVATRHLVFHLVFHPAFHLADLPAAAASVRPGRAPAA